MIRNIRIINLLFICFFSCADVENNTSEIPSLEKFSDGIHHWNLFHANDYYARYEPGQYIQIADNLLCYQNKDGGWPKNIDWLAIIDKDSLMEALPEKDKKSTLDNNNTFPQIEYLAKVYQLSQQERFRKGVEKGIGYLLDTRNPNGGWRGWDVDAITYNDQVMTGVMNLFLDIVEQHEYYKWMDKMLVDSLNQCLQRTIEITLNCQIVLNGKKTAWCQQHDHITFQPVKARSYELASITAKESVDIVRFLMRIKNPEPEVINAIKSAVAWFDSAKIKGIKLEKIPLTKDEIINKEYPYDLVIVEDSTAQPIWARYYDLQAGKPFLCRRDGRIVYTLQEISPERRTGYEWYGYWPEQLIDKEYKDWLNRIKN